jgi:glycosyltransferase involved in cell wall biosynthesis
MKIPCSVIVMTKNEERNIEKCLRSAQGFAETFVVDSRSVDRTCEIAAGLGARVVQFDWNGKYPKKKQWCLENLPFSYDWVLYLDADEELTPAAAEEIRAEVCGRPKHSGYFAGYDYIFLGCVLRHGHRVYKLVLFDRHKAAFRTYNDLSAKNAGEVELHYQPSIDGSIGLLRKRIIHDDHVSLFHYFERHNSYSDWEAVVRIKGDSGGKESHLSNRRRLKKVFAWLPCKGLIAFTDSYILKGGFFDGYAGFHFAVARGVYYWQIGLKLRELEVAQRQLNSVVSSVKSTDGTENWRRHADQ